MFPSWQQVPVSVDPQMAQYQQQAGMYQWPGMYSGGWAPQTQTQPGVSMMQGQFVPATPQPPLPGIKDGSQPAPPPHPPDQPPPPKDDKPPLPPDPPPPDESKKEDMKPADPDESKKLQELQQQAQQWQQTQQVWQQQQQPSAVQWQQPAAAQLQQQQPAAPQLQQQQQPAAPQLQQQQPAAPQWQQPPPGMGWQPPVSQWQQPNSQWQQWQQQTPQWGNYGYLGGPPHGPPPAIPDPPRVLHDIMQEEREFENQYAQWKQQYVDWQEENKNHPNREQFDQYLQQWKMYESQMEDKKADLLRRKREAEQAVTNQSHQNLPVSAHGPRFGGPRFEAPKFEGPRGPGPQGSRPLIDAGPRPPMERSQIPPFEGGPRPPMAGTVGDKPQDVSPHMPPSEGGSRPPMSSLGDQPQAGGPRMPAFEGESRPPQIPPFEGGQRPQIPGLLGEQPQAGGSQMPSFEGGSRPPMSGLGDQPHMGGPRISRLEGETRPPQISRFEGGSRPSMPGFLGDQSQMGGSQKPIEGGPRPPMPVGDNSQVGGPRVSHFEGGSRPPGPGLSGDQSKVGGSPMSHFEGGSRPPRPGLVGDQAQMGGPRMTHFEGGSRPPMPGLLGDKPQVGGQQNPPFEGGSRQPVPGLVDQPQEGGPRMPHFEGGSRSSMPSFLRDQSQVGGPRMPNFEGGSRPPTSGILGNQPPIGGPGGPRFGSSPCEGPFLEEGQSLNEMGEEDMILEDQDEPSNEPFFDEMAEKEIMADLKIVTEIGYGQGQFRPKNASDINKMYRAKKRLEEEFGTSNPDEIRIRMEKMKCRRPPVDNMGPREPFDGPNMNQNPPLLGGPQGPNMDGPRGPRFGGPPQDGPGFRQRGPRPDGISQRMDNQRPDDARFPGNRLGGLPNRFSGPQGPRFEAPSNVGARFGGPRFGQVGLQGPRPGGRGAGARGPIPLMELSFDKPPMQLKEEEEVGEDYGEEVEEEWNEEWIAEQENQNNIEGEEDMEGTGGPQDEPPFGFGGPRGQQNFGQGRLMGGPMDRPSGGPNIQPQVQPYRPHGPGAITGWPGRPNTGPVRPPGPNAGPPRPSGPNAGPVRPPGPNTGPVRPPGPNAGPPRPSGPNAGPPRLPGPNSGPPRMPEPSNASPREPGPDGASPRHQGPNTAPPRPPGSNATPPRPPGSNAASFRPLGPDLGPSRMPGPNSTPPRLVGPSITQDKAGVPNASPSGATGPAGTPGAQNQKDSSTTHNESKDQPDGKPAFGPKGVAESKTPEQNDQSAKVKIDDQKSLSVDEKKKEGQKADSKQKPEEKPLQSPRGTQQSVPKPPEKPQGQESGFQQPPSKSNQSQSASSGPKPVLSGPGIMPQTGPQSTGPGEDNSENRPPFSEFEEYNDEFYRDDNFNQDWNMSGQGWPQESEQEEQFPSQGPWQDRFGQNQGPGMNEYDVQKNQQSQQQRDMQQRNQWRNEQNKFERGPHQFRDRSQERNMPNKERMGEDWNDEQERFDNNLYGEQNWSDDFDTNMKFHPGDRGLSRGRGRGNEHGRGRGNEHSRGRGNEHGRGRGIEHGRGHGNEYGRGRGNEHGIGRQQNRGRGWGNKPGPEAQHGQDSQAQQEGWFNERRGFDGNVREWNEEKNWEEEERGWEEEGNFDKDQGRGPIQGERPDNTMPEEREQTRLSERGPLPLTGPDHFDRFPDSHDREPFRERFSPNSFRDPFWDRRDPYMDRRDPFGFPPPPPPLPLPSYDFERRRGYFDDSYRMDYDDRFRDYRERPPLVEYPPRLAAGPFKPTESIDYGHKPTASVPPLNASKIADPPRPFVAPQTVIDYGHGQSPLDSADSRDRGFNSPMNRDPFSNRPYMPPSHGEPRPPPGPPPPTAMGPKIEVVKIEDLLCLPGRESRPPQIVVIVRGLPGSGKTYVSKLIKDKECANGGSAPRMLCLDDYFMVEVDKIEKDPETGKKVKKKSLEYEYEADMEHTYRQNMLKSFKKTIDDGFFPFIVLDAVFDKVRHFEDFWSYAKSKGFQVYVSEMQADVSTCVKRNVHKRTQREIEKLKSKWEDTPRHFIRLDIRSLLQEVSITEVEMEDTVDVVQPPAAPAKPKAKEEEEEEEEVGAYKKSRWELDVSGEKLDKLDGLVHGNKRKPHSPQSMDDFLQLTDDYYTRTSQPGKKRVRWADIEERKEQIRRRELGFVVGQTQRDWERITDDSYADRQLNRTKYF